MGKPKLPAAMRKLLEECGAKLAAVKLDLPGLHPPAAAPAAAPIEEMPLSKELPRAHVPMLLPTAMQMPASFQSSTEPTLSDYLDIVRKRLWSVAGVFALVGGTCLLYGMLKTPLYRGETILRYEPTGLSAGGAGGLAALGGGMSMMTLGPAIETQVNLLTSLDMHARIAKKLGKSMAKIDKFYKVNKLSQSSLLQITVDDPDPALAAVEANFIGDLFVSWDLELRSRGAQRLLNDLSAKRKVVETQMQLLADQRKAYLSGHEDVTLYGALAGQLLDLEARRKELLQKFTEVHPEVQRVDNRIEIIRQKLRGVPGEEAALKDIERNLRVAEETFVTLSKQVEEARIALNSTLSYLTVVSRAIPPPKPIHSKGYYILVAFVLGAGAAFLTAVVLEFWDISITTPEEIEKATSAPVLAVIPDFGRKKLGCFDDMLRRRCSELDAFRPLLIFQHPPKSPQIEGYHGLWLKIQGQMERRSKLVLAVTSTGMAEGKTLTASNFALACAQSGCKTLLIGADLRKPFLYQALGLSKEAPGFADAVAGRCRWEDAVRDASDCRMDEPSRRKMDAFPGIDNFKVMSDWMDPRTDIISILSSPALPKIISEVRSAFDLVVFDTPPSLLFVDAVLIGKHADGVVMVYESGKISSRILRRAKEQIAASRARMLGIVMNAAQASEMGPGYGYYRDTAERASAGLKPDG